MQLRKVVKAIAAGTLAAIMAGATVGFAATLADYPAPFVSDSTVDALIVVGENAATADVVGAIDLAARLGAVPGEEKTVTVSGVTTTTVSGGVALDTASKKIYLGDALNKAKDTLTESDLPTILAGGEFKDNDDETYDYDLYIDVGSNTVVFDQPETDEDPVLMVQMSTSSSSPLYTAKIVFNKPVDFTNAGGEKITLFGKDFTVSSSDTTADKLVLYKSAQEITMNKDDETTVTIGGVEYTIKVLGFDTSGTTDKVILMVNEETDDVEEEDSNTIGGLEIYAKTVTSWDNGNQGIAVLQVGTEKVTLEAGQPVKIGDNEEEVDGTYVKFNEGTSSGQVDELSTIEILVYAPNDENDYIGAGSSFTDPIFETFKVAFGGMSYGPGYEDREEIKITGDSNSGNIYFTDTEGETKSTQFVYYDSDTTTWYVAGGDNAKYAYVLAEGTTYSASNIKNKYYILGTGDTAHILEVTSVSIDEDTTADNDDYITLTDRRTNDPQKIEFEATDGSTTTKDFYIEGKKYTLTYDGTNDVLKITDNIDGYTVFPTIETSKGAKFTVMTKLTDFVTDPSGDETSAGTSGNYVTVVLPTGTLYLDSYSDGTTDHAKDAYSTDGSTWTDFSTATAITVGGVKYIVTPDSSDGTFDIDIDRDQDGSADTSVVPTFMLIEEENDKPTTATQYKIIVPFKYDSDDGVGTVTTTSSIKFTESGVSFKDSSDDDLKYALTSYGTYLKLDVSENVGTLTITYPDNQMYALVAIGENPTWSTSGGTGGTITYKEVVPITTPIAKLDSEVTDADKSTKNLILVGGPCANALVQELVDAGKLGEEYTCAGGVPGSAWEANTGYILLVEDAFATGKVALVVAGTTATETVEACHILQDYEAHAGELTGTAVKIVNSVITPITV